MIIDLFAVILCFAVNIYFKALVDYKIIYIELFNLLAFFCLDSWLLIHKVNVLHFPFVGKAVIIFVRYNYMVDENDTYCFTS